jgi:NNP family nitrate/nitrite transporter-like MFS transporter
MEHIHPSGDLGKKEEDPGSLASQIAPLLFLTGIFLLISMSRNILSPLMPAIKQELGLGHDEAGSLFLLVTLGHSFMVLGSGFISSRLNHRKTIILSSLAIGGALFAVALSPGIWEIRIGLVFAGLAAGLYIPSGIATLTGLVRPGDWGKAVAVHELAPNLSFLAAPLLTEALLGFLSWRGILVLLGVTSVFCGLIFIRFGKGGRFPGEAPRVSTLKIFMVEPSFWLMMGLFALGIGGSSGVYSMLPLYLIAARDMERGFANTLMGLSRIPTLFTSFVAGWVTDRIGPKRTLIGIFMLAGLATILMGTVRTSWIVPIVFLQPILAASFFPAGFAALSRIGSPQIKNLAVSLTIPFSFIIGAGAIPAGIGIFGEAGLFSLGISLLGVILLGGVILSSFLKLKTV